MPAILYRPRLAAALALGVLVATCFVLGSILLAGAGAESRSADRVLAQALSLEPISAADSSAMFRVSSQGREVEEEVPLTLVVGLRPPLSPSAAPLRATAQPLQAPPTPVAQVPAGYSAQVWVEPDLSPASAPQSRLLTLVLAAAGALCTAGGLSLLALRLHARLTRHLRAPDYVPLEWVDVHSDR